MQRTFLSPRAHRLLASRPVTPLERLDGVVLGLFDNAKPGAALLLDLVAERIRERVPIAGVHRAGKPTPSSPAPDAVYGELERECGAVLFASAD